MSPAPSLASAVTVIISASVNEVSVEFPSFANWLSSVTLYAWSAKFASTGVVALPVALFMLSINLSWVVAVCISLAALFVSWEKALIVILLTSPVPTCIPSTTLNVKA